MHIIWPTLYVQIVPLIDIDISEDIFTHRLWNYIPYLYGGN